MAFEWTGTRWWREQNAIFAVIQLVVILTQIKIKDLFWKSLSQLKSWLELKFFKKTIEQMGDFNLIIDAFRLDKVKKNVK